MRLCFSKKVSKLIQFAESRSKSTREENKNFIYQGIAERNFERKFQLADYVKVVGASMENGLLHIDLVREIPEAMQPRKIAIGGNNLIENS